MTKQSTLRDIHVLGNGGRSDLAWILIGGQVEYRLNGDCSPLGGRNAFEGAS